jgi:hypothetical protein
MAVHDRVLDLAQYGKIVATPAGSRLKPTTLWEGTV